MKSPFSFSKKGFTLVETLIAMIILAGALIVLMNSWSGSFSSLGRSRQLTTMSFLLQKKMTEFELKYKDRPLSDIPDEEDGDFGDDYKSISWTMKSKKLEIPDMSSALTSRPGGATEVEIMIVKQLTEMIEDAVKEMKVSVIFKNEQKTLEHSLATYMVEYKKEGPTP
ncbi:MAG: prepilin-type N-terminal cleavage/methylation domain-containing protein [Bdellovibrionales bacterium]